MQLLQRLGGLLFDHPVDFYVRKWYQRQKVKGQGHNADR